MTYTREEMEARQTDCSVSLKLITRDNVKAQGEWAAVVVNMARFSSRSRLIDDVYLYTKGTLLEHLDMLTKRNQKYVKERPSAPYWMVFERAKQVMPVHDVREVADFMFSGDAYWESIA